MNQNTNNKSTKENKPTEDQIIKALEYTKLGKIATFRIMAALNATKSHLIFLDWLAKKYYNDELESITESEALEQVIKIIVHEEWT